MYPGYYGKSYLFAKGYTLWYNDACTTSNNFVIFAELFVTSGLRFATFEIVDLSLFGAYYAKFPAPGSGGTIFWVN